jgi:signal transduction histidine kinase
VSQVLYLRDVTHETEVDRMKSEFLSTAAHELRTPMTSIYGFVQLLTLRRMDESRTRDLLGTIARQSGLMIEIINQLLDLARIESRRGQDFRREPHALADLVRAVLEGYRLPPGREPAQVQSDLQLPDVIGDGQKLQQALLNIIANAYKYSPAGGPVNIALLQRCDDDGRNQIGVAVSDTGIGMTAEQLTHVCERFYRADSSGNIPGTGLGMAIVKEIIDLHSGELHLQSQPGAGSTVTLWLPAAIQGTEPLPQRRLPALAPPQTPSPAAPHPPSPADAALPH